MRNVVVPMDWHFEVPYFVAVVVAVVAVVAVAAVVAAVAVVANVVISH